MTLIHTSGFDPNTEQHQKQIAELRLQRDAIAQSAYLSLVLCTLTLATAHGFDLKCVDNVFIVTDPSEHEYNKCFRILPRHCVQADELLGYLTAELSVKTNEIETRERESALRQAALAKLSMAEREILGV